jgi:predicted PurR-regulated permease PerM
MNSGAIEVSEVGEGTWSIRRSSANGTRGPPVGGSPGEAGFDLEERLNHVIESAVTFSNEQLASLIEFAQHLVVGILEAIIAILMTLMVAAFISIDLPRFMGFFRGLVPEAWHTDFDDLLGEVDRGLSGVIRGQLIICVINGLFTYIGLVLIDVKFSVLLAVIAGLFSIIPVFGAVISTIPICLVALTQGLMPALLILGWILGIHFIEGNILNPKIIGTSAEIHPVIVIFALLAGESTYGLVGAILAVPVASIILSLYKFSRDKLWEDEERSALPEEKTLNQN